MRLSRGIALTVLAASLAGAVWYAIDAPCNAEGCRVALIPERVIPVLVRPDVQEIDPDRKLWQSPELIPERDVFPSPRDISLPK